MPGWVAPWVKPMLITLAALAAGLGATTWWALESGGVAVIETQAPVGTVRSTHVWYAKQEGELWLEAGTPGNPWYLDIQRDPQVSFSSLQQSGQFIAKRVQDPRAHDQIRALLREKYGVRDWWIGLLFDTSRSVAVRLVPEEG